ncbi:MAG TPA: response regulator transcription factor [Pedococcus sp.]|jgi:two-component system KDP operon response regulator KdpE
MSVVLVVDDEPHLVRTLAINLRARDYRVETAGDGRSALQAFHEREPDLVVLDLGLPDLDGVEVLRRIREVSMVPVIVLSARTESVDKVEALDLGADDYVTKPFGMEELLARVRVALRRRSDGDEPAQAAFETRRFRLDFDERTAVIEGVETRLTPTEWKLLSVLARRPGHLVSQRDLLREVWGPGYGRESNYLRVYANQLRRKLEPEPARPRYLLTEPGQGYRLVGDDHTPDHGDGHVDGPDGAAGP